MERIAHMVGSLVSFLEAVLPVSEGEFYFRSEILFFPILALVAIAGLAFAVVCKRRASALAKSLLKKNTEFESLKEHFGYDEILLSALDVSTALFDAKMNIVSRNKASEGIIHSEPEKMLTAACPCALKLAKCMGVGCIIRRAFQEKVPVSAEVKTYGKDWIATCRPIMGGNSEVKNILCTLVDTTELRERERRIESAMKKEQVANMSKSLFIATMGHEIRTPLNTIVGFSQICADPKLSESERIENLQNIKISADALLHLINDILDISKLEAGKILVEKSAVNISSLLKEVCPIFENKCRSRHLDFILESGNLPVLSMDGKRFRQIFVNLVGNAVKFTETGTVSVSLKYDGTALEMTVSDTGIGIEPDFIPELFLPFQQYAEPISNIRCSDVGTGLGLSISKKLLDQMGGTISITSKLGSGTVFTVRIPAEKCAPVSSKKDEAQPRLSRTQASGEEGKYGEEGKLDIFRKKGIVNAVIVDDIKMNLKVLSAILRRLGVECSECSTAGEALKIISSERPSIVLTDLWMPEMNGDELAHEIRKMSGTEDLPIVVVTADVLIGEQRAAAFDDVILKPVSIDKIQSVLKKFI